MAARVQPSGMDGRDRGRLFVAAVLGALTLLALGVWSSPAVAFSQRGHVFGFAFGGEGQGAGEFSLGGTLTSGVPAGVAVDEATGDVYVVDSGNSRVQEFSASGAFIAAWGWGVADGKAEFELCTSSCQAGLPGGGKGQLREPAAIAVDNSQGGTGTVYVGAKGVSKKPDVERFGADGEKPLGKLPVEEEGQLEGLAVDGHGTAWLYRGEEEETGVIEGFSGGLKPVRLEPTLTSPLECPKAGFGVDAGGEHFFVDHELLTGEDECPAVLEREKREEKEPAEGGLLRPVVAGLLSGEELLARQLDRQNTAGIAVDQGSGEGTPLGAAATGDVYLDNGTSVAALDASGGLIQRFGTGEIKAGEGVAVNAKTGDVYVLDAGEDNVKVFLPEGEGAPSVSGLSALDVTPSEVELSATVNPNGPDTHYFFQYGTADCVSDPGACIDVPAAPGSDIGGGFGEQGVSVTLTGLTPSTTYHYRVLASNSLGSAEGSETHGTFRTLPSSAGLLADGRAWELVSPAEKDGSGIEPFEKEGSVIQTAAEGGAVTYVANGPVVAEPEGSRAPEPTQVLSTRTPAGWSSQDLMTPHEHGEGLEAGEPSEFRFFSEDLALSLVEPPGGKVAPLEAPPLAPDASEKTLYVRADAPLAPAGSEHARYAEAEANKGFLAPGFAPLVLPAPERGKFGGKLGFLDATPDLGRVVFESEVPLLAGSAAGLYESEPGGLLQLASVLPDGTAAVSPSLGGEGSNVRGAVSADGSRVVFWAEGQEGAANGLYLRDTARGETVQVNAAQGVVEPTGEESEVDFQAATADGSRVFFTDTAPLTPGSNQHQQLETDQRREADLYACEVTEKAGKLACNLTDLTPLPVGGSADVLNVIPGVSADGSSVYFVANGVLAPGAKPGHCVHQSQETAPAGATCNLYESHDGTISFIAALSNEDSGDWGSLHGSGRVGDFIANRPDLADVTSRVSPNGEFLAFMSSMPLTGYDNTDANNPGVRDQEVFLYDAATGLLTCASCNPNAPSVGVHDIEHSGEGIGLLVDRRQDWSGAYLAGSLPGWAPLGLDGAIHQPRYLSDSGRLFFNSPDRLVPQATNAKMNVYEYEPHGTGSCARPEGCVSLISSGTAAQESAFLDASENGQEAFFLTAQPLVAADHDTNFDLYDARVCTAGSPCLTSEESSERPCETSGSCKPPPAPPPTFDAPATATYTGPGNATSSTTSPPKTEVRGVAVQEKKPPTRAQLLAKALKSCRRHYRNKHKRLACEKQARRRYAPKTRANKTAKHASRTGR